MTPTVPNDGKGVTEFRKQGVFSSVYPKHGKSEMTTSGRRGWDGVYKEYR